MCHVCVGRGLEQQRHVFVVLLFPFAAKSASYRESFRLLGLRTGNKASIQTRDNLLSAKNCARVVMLPASDLGPILRTFEVAKEFYFSDV